MSDAFDKFRAAGFWLRSVVHTVGVFQSRGTLVETPDADFKELFDVNVMTTVHVVQAALMLMLPANAGRIAVVASGDAG